MKEICKNVWTLTFPLKIAGFDAGRTVCVIRLGTGELVIHSTGPFERSHIEWIGSLGRPGWILDAMLDHDTFASAGREAFPGIPFLAPRGFGERVDFPVQELSPAPPEWGAELQVLELAGAPGFSEHVLFHTPSGTLVVCDLLFNFPHPPNLWTSLLLRAGVGAKFDPGVSRRLRFAIQDKSAFRKSIQTMLEWDIERVVVGHGEAFSSDAEGRVKEALARAKLH